MQCSFTSKDEACTLCQNAGITNCVKMLGPKKATRTSTASLYVFSPYASTPVPGFDNYDADLPPEDRFLLQRGVEIWIGQTVMSTSARHGYTTFLNISMRLFGRSFNHPSLRPACCALLSEILPGVQPLLIIWLTPVAKEHPNRESYRSKAQASLIPRLGMPECLDEGDLFASFILAMTTCICGEDDGEHLSMHIHGFINILCTLSTRLGQELCSASLFPFLTHRLFSRMESSLMLPANYESIRLCLSRTFATVSDVYITRNPLDMASTGSLPFVNHTNRNLVGAFDRCLDVLSHRVTLPFHHPLDPGSTDRGLVRQMSTFLLPNWDDDIFTFIDVPAERFLTFPSEKSKEWLFFLVYTGPAGNEFSYYPLAKLSWLFERLIYNQLLRLMVTILDASSLKSGVHSSACQETIHTIGNILNHTATKLENLRDLLWSTLQGGNVELFRGICIFISRRG
jgi:hypothetical protein